jgi:hypothetical protein
MVDERRRQPERPRERAVPSGGLRVARPDGDGSARTRGRSRAGRPPKGPVATGAWVTTPAGPMDRPGTPPAAVSASTRAVFRLLLLRGLSEAEAANLTAFLCGLPVGERPWQLREVNQLLFLRELHRRGRLGRGDLSAGLDDLSPPRT